MGLKELELNFLSLFRELFVYHHRSLEFRAKLFAAMISVDPNTKDSIYEVVKNIGLEIYGRDKKRVEILVRTTKEYVKKVVTNNGLNLDELIFDIDKILKNHQRYAKKINLNHLKRLQEKDDNEIKLVQQRIIEFVQAQILQYTENR